jgi:hypothetical protein
MVQANVSTLDRVITPRMSERMELPDAICLSLRAPAVHHPKISEPAANRSV